MRPLLIDLHDVLGRPIKGDTVTLEVPDPRPADDGAVVRPFQRLIELDEDGKATVDVETGPLLVKMHNTYGQQIVIDTNVPEGTEPITLRQLILMHIGTVGDVPGLTEALDELVTKTAFDIERDNLRSDINSNATDIAVLMKDLDGKAPTEHTHTIDDVAELANELATKASVDHTHALTDIEGMGEALDTKADNEHTHRIADVAGLTAELLGKASVEHTHTVEDVEGLSNALTQLTNSLGEKATAEHTHELEAINGLMDILNTKLDLTEHERTTRDYAATEVAKIVDGAPESLDTLREIAEALADQGDAYTALVNVVAGKAPIVHTHTIANVTGLQAQLDGKATSSHTHTIANVTGLQAQLDGKAAKSVVTRRLDWDRNSPSGWINCLLAGTANAYPLWGAPGMYEVTLSALHAEGIRILDWDRSGIPFYESLSSNGAQASLSVILDLKGQARMVCRVLNPKENTEIFLNIRPLSLT